MANVKISNLTAAATPLAGTEVLPVVQSGTTVKASIANVQTATYSGGTANGVAYLNGSKVLTTGSALVFDGTNLGVGVTPSAWGSGSKAVELGGSGSYFALNNTSANGFIYWNMWYDGTNNKTKQTGNIAAYGYSSGGAHVWFNGTGTTGATSILTQAMTLDANGGLGIGTTSITSGAGYKFLQVNGTTSGIIEILCNGTRVGGMYCDPTGSSGNGDFIIRNIQPGAITFSTNSAERARIDSSGNLLVGTTAQVGTANTPLTLRKGGITWQVGPANANGNFYVLNASDVGVYLANNGTSWTANSDERLKDIIEPITDAANKVSTLRAVIGKYKTDEEGIRRSFLIAQDVQSVFPEAVDAADPDKLGVQYTEVIPLLVAAIKEQSALITQLQADVAALKGA